MINNPVMNRDGLISTADTSDLTRMINDQQSQAAGLVPGRDMEKFDARFSQMAPQGIAPIYEQSIAAQNKNMVKNSAKQFIQNKILTKFGIPDLAAMGLTGQGMTFPSVIGLASQFLPKEDPATTATRQYYEGLYGLDDIGRIQEGDLMANYNPISGGGLYTLTGGRVGDPPTLGLDKAYEKRISGIEKTLRNKYKMTDTDLKDIYAGNYQGDVTSDLINRLVTLKDRQTSDRSAINKIKMANRGAVGGNLSRRQINERKVNYNQKDVNRETYRGRTPTKTKSVAPAPKKSNVHRTASYDRRK